MYDAPWKCWKIEFLNEGYMCILSRSQLDEREANEKFLEAMLLIADVRDVKEEEDIRALRS